LNNLSKYTGDIPILSDISRTPPIPIDLYNGLGRKGLIEIGADYWKRTNN
jgi:hypothetical protein